MDIAAMLAALLEDLTGYLADHVIVLGGRHSGKSITHGLDFICQQAKRKWANVRGLIGLFQFKLGDEPDESTLATTHQIPNPSSAPSQ